MGSLGRLIVISYPYGIVYYFLIDYVDGLLSLKHKPSIVIVDMAYIIANYANNTHKKDNRKYGKADEEGRLFLRYEGCVASSDDSEAILLSNQNFLLSNQNQTKTRTTSKFSMDVINKRMTDIRLLGGTYISGFSIDFMKKMCPVILNICAE